MKSKKETTAQFSRLMVTQEHKCRQLTTDKGTEFTSVAFNQLMVASDIRHVYKEALNDLSTIDRAMGLIKDRIGVIVAERGGTWLDVLQQVINAHNGLDTKALLGNAPEDVFEDAEFRFRWQVREPTSLKQRVGSGRCCRKRASKGARACPIGLLTCIK